MGVVDDLVWGWFIFMVEMVEIVVILNQVDDYVLVIFDEIGCGMVIWDGLFIVWVVMEYLYVKNCCCVLFVMYYYEMISLLVWLFGVENVIVSVCEWEGEVIFLYEVCKGVVDCSYGV